MPATAWVALVVGVIGFGGVIAGLVQRTKADNRAEWWRRAGWAIDHTLSENVEAQTVGFGLLEQLQTDKLATKDDRRLFNAWMTPQVLDDNDADIPDTGDKEASS